MSHSYRTPLTVAIAEPTTATVATLTQAFAAELTAQALVVGSFTFAQLDERTWLFEATAAEFHHVTLLPQLAKEIFERVFQMPVVEVPLPQNVQS